MRASLRLILLVAGLATLFAILAAGSAAGVGVTFEDVDYPEVVYVDEEITVTFTLVLDGYTWDQVNVAGVTYYDGFIGEFYNHSKDPRAVFVEGNEALTFSVDITMPDTAGDQTMWGFCHIKGFVTDYTQNLGAFVVKDRPLVQFAGTLGWNLVGRQHEIRANVQGAGASEIEEVSVYWDTVGHGGEGQDKALYPNRSAVITYQLLSPYYLNITLPSERSTVYILVHGLINGRDFYDSSERSISVEEEPGFEVVAPSAAFKGTNVVIDWSIPTTPGAHLENTSVYWDTVSHASAIDVANYAHRSDVLPGSDPRSYGLMLAMPDEEGTVYFLVHCVLKLHGYEFTTPTEHTIELIPEPAVTVTEHADSAFVGEDVHFVWTVSAPGAAVEETAIHWDTSSHAGALDVAAYPHASVWMIGEDDRTYDVTFEMPDTAGTLYFIAHALVLGQDFYVAEEMSISVRELPAVSIISVPDEAFAGETVTVTWEVSGVLETEDVSTSLHWDTTSHPDMDPLEYAEHSDPSQGTGHGTHTHDIVMPEGKVTLYLMVSAEVRGVTVTSGTERTIVVRAMPSVVNVTGPAKVDGGKDASVTFTLEDVDDPDKVEVLWDTSSHDNGTGYPNSVEATDNGDGTWTVEFKVPDKDVDVFYRVHVEKDGDDVYSDESSFEVMKVEEDSPGFTFILIVVALAAIAVHVTSRRRY